MSTRILLLSFLFAALPAVAAIQSTSDGLTRPDKTAPVTVTGHWIGKHPHWKSDVEIRADGTFSRAGGDGGKWTLTTENDHSVLLLNWDRWKANTLTLIDPNLFRGKTTGGTFELRRVTDETAAAANAKPAPEWLKEFDDPALKARLVDSVWALHDGKHFKLHSDGTTTGSWHDRKGAWRIVGPNKVQLTNSWRPQSPAIATVEADGSLLRWSDADWGQLAKRVEPARKEQ